jgi:hypothetical protein
MTLAEGGSLTIAILSFLMASVAAYWTYALSHRQLRLGSRHEFQKLLLEMNKELVRDPELWGVYDAHPMAQIKRDDPAHQAKLEAFTYLILNMHNIVFLYSSEGGSTSDSEQAFFAAYEGTHKDFVSSSSLAKDILSRRDSELVYEPRFLAHAKSLSQG